MSKQNEPMTKERLEASAFQITWKPEPDRQSGRVVVLLRDALAYGDERYEAGLMTAARAICKYCADPNPVRAELHRPIEGWWTHPYAESTCFAGPIHDLLRAEEE